VNILEILNCPQDKYDALSNLLKHLYCFDTTIPHFIPQLREGVVTSRCVGHHCPHCLITISYDPCRRWVVVPIRLLQSSQGRAVVERDSALNHRSQFSAKSLTKLRNLVEVDIALDDAHCDLSDLAAVFW
jgi:hypothetical protein